MVLEISPSKALVNHWALRRRILEHAKYQAPASTPLSGFVCLLEELQGIIFSTLQPYDEKPGQAESRMLRSFPLRAQRDEDKSKVMSQFNELNIIRQPLYGLET
ncbi:hypothetical protein C8Q70DRAFT_1051630 [Cubamyces menziesii]|nr:hypothetical protein C8Q70DRAFT_1051630 [Cubamyces menziesii]